MTVSGTTRRAKWVRSHLLDGLNATFAKDSEETNDIELKGAIVLGIVITSDEPHVDMWGSRDAQNTARSRFKGSK